MGRSKPLGLEMSLGDQLTFVICILLSLFSATMIISLYDYQTIELRTVVMQLVAMAIGVVGVLILSKVNYHTAVRWNIIFAIVAIGLVLLLKVPGLAFTPVGSDDQAWIKIGVLSLQPSEILKLVFIYTFSKHLSQVAHHINEVKTFLLLCLHGAVPTLLIMDTGDYGSALVFFFIFVVMIFAADLNRRLLLIGVGVLAALTPVVWWLLPDYLQQRFVVAWHPELDASGMGYQQYQGLEALSSGGLWGKGLFDVEDLVYVPESSNDFIFSYIGQSTGLVGCVTVVVLLAVILCKVLHTAMHATDELGAFICIGVFGMLLSQAFINIGMVLCVIPVVGLTLPFLSAGGTSLMVCFLSIGMVLGVSAYGRAQQEE